MGMLTGLCARRERVRQLNSPAVMGNALAIYDDAECGQLPAQLRRAFVVLGGGALPSF